MKAYTESSTPKHDRDEAVTPWWVVWRIEALMGIEFDLDVCATSSNAKAEAYLRKNNNALTYDWRLIACQLDVCWMNPPYSQLAAFTRKASDEARRGLIVVGLVPHMSSSKWFQQYVDRECCTVYVPDGRINFEDRHGNAMQGNPLPSCFPVWTPWRPGTRGANYVYFERNKNEWIGLGSASS